MEILITGKGICSAWNSGIGRCDWIWNLLQKSYLYGIAQKGALNARTMDDKADTNMHAFICGSYLFLIPFIEDMYNVLLCILWDVHHRAACWPSGKTSCFMDMAREFEYMCDLQMHILNCLVNSLFSNESSLNQRPVSQKTLSPLVILSMEKTMGTMVISELKSFHDWRRMLIEENFKYYHTLVCRQTITCISLWSFSMPVSITKKSQNLDKCLSKTTELATIWASSLKNYMCRLLFMLDRFETGQRSFGTPRIYDVTIFKTVLL